MRSLFDTALDRAVVPGYSSVGYRLRQIGWADDPEPGALKGRTALVTGANRGIGMAIAAGLARQEIVAADSEAVVQVEVCDVSDLGAVRAFAADLTSRVKTLDVLIHNAVILMSSGGAYTQPLPALDPEYRKERYSANGPAARARRWAAVAAVAARGVWPRGTPARSPWPPSANRSLR
jgi:NAD(P)-dependent dehydrogenase (short-subunit alcohol dehydrogenase family)